MALHEADERPISTQLLEAKRWVQELVFDDWGLKLLALAIAIALWGGVTSRGSSAMIRLRGVELMFLLPEDLEISSEPHDEVQVTLRGSRQALDTLNVRRMIASVNLQNYKPGERVVRLTPERVTIELPDGVQIEKIEPDTVPLRVERSVEREVEVRAQFGGAPPAGYKVLDVEVTPSRVRVRGPESHIIKLDQVLTEPISLDGRTEGFTDTYIAVDIPNRKVAVLDTIVAVHVKIAEEQTRKHSTAVTSKSANQAASKHSAIVTSINLVCRAACSVVEVPFAENKKAFVQKAEGAA